MKHGSMFNKVAYLRKQLDVEVSPQSGSLPRARKPSLSRCHGEALASSASGILSLPRCLGGCFATTQATSPTHKCELRPMAEIDAICSRPPRKGGPSQLSNPPARFSGPRGSYTTLPPWYSPRAEKPLAVPVTVWYVGHRSPNGPAPPFQPLPSMVGIVGICPTRSALYCPHAAWSPAEIAGAQAASGPSGLIFLAGRAPPSSRLSRYLLCPEKGQQVHAPGA